MEDGVVAPPVSAVTTDGGVVAEVLAKHGRSAQPESQQVVAVMRAVCDVVRCWDFSPLHEQP